MAPPPAVPLPPVLRADPGSPASGGSWLARHRLSLLWALACGVVLTLLAAPLDGLERRLLSGAQQTRGPRPVPAGVVIVAIDDTSLAQAAQADLSDDPLLRRLGDWPWPRAVQATLLQRLFAAGARAVAFDLLFDSPSVHGPADDQVLAQGLAAAQGRVLLAAQVLESSGTLAGLSLSEPVAPLRSALGPQGTGLVNSLADDDGSLRERPSLYGRLLQRSGPRDLPPSLVDRLEALHLRAGGAVRQPLASALPAWLAGAPPLLDFYGPPGTIPTVPAWDLLESGRYGLWRAEGLFRGALVLVGPTAGALQDRHSTAFAGPEGMPGVEVLATELANRIEGRALVRLGPWRGWLALFPLITLLLALAAEREERPLRRLGLLAMVAAALALLAWTLVVTVAVAVPLFTLALLTLLTALLSAGEATLRLEWQRRRLRRTLERYLSPAVAAEIAAQPEEAASLLGGRLADVVVLMADVRGFTERSRRMGEQGRVAQLVDQLNDYLAEVVAAVHGEGGTVDKFIGDAVLAVFGAPLARGDQQEVEAALRTALALEQRLQALNARWALQGLEPWQQVVVLSYGRVICGNIGASSRMEYTVIGDAVNLCSRLEAVAKRCQRSLVFSAAVAERAGSHWPIEFLGEEEIRGLGPERIHGLRHGHLEPGLDAPR